MRKSYTIIALVQISLERRSPEKGLINNVPCTAEPVNYRPPSPADVAEKAADAGGGPPPLGRSPSIIQRRGYTSDEDLEDLDSPLTSIIDRRQPPAAAGNGNGTLREAARSNLRFKLLLEVWSE